MRSTLMVYVCLHISTYYCGGNNNGVPSFFSSSSKDNTLAVILRCFVKPNCKIPPVFLSFAGYAAKFINLLVNSINLYRDGECILSGPNLGKMRMVLVETMRIMVSVST